MIKADIFHGNELVRIGIIIEKNGYDFYEIMAKKAKKNALKKIFDFLAGEEKRHIIRFNIILKSAQGDRQADSYPGEYKEYLRQLAKEYVFTKAETAKAVTRRIKNDKAALDIAIGFEKDSILFYEAMRAFLRDAEKKIIEELINEEKNHYLKLSEIKNKKQH